MRNEPVFGEEERVALEYANAITSNCDVKDPLFTSLRRFYDDAIVELTAVSAW